MSHRFPGGECRGTGNRFAIELANRPIEMGLPTASSLFAPTLPVAMGELGLSAKDLGFKKSKVRGPAGARSASCRDWAFRRGGPQAWATSAISCTIANLEALRCRPKRARCGSAWTICEPSPRVYPSAEVALVSASAMPRRPYSAARTRWPAGSGMAELNVLSGS